MKSLLTLFFVLISLSVFSQVDKKQIKTVYETTFLPNEDRSYYTYYEYNTLDELTKKGNWKLDSISKKKIKTYSKKIAQTKQPKLTKQFDSLGNLISEISFYNKGKVKGLLKYQKAYFYNSKNLLSETQTHIGQVDTLDFGFDQLNMKIKISPENITYELIKVNVEIYNNKEQLIEDTFLDLSKYDIGKYIYQYDENNSIIQSDFYIPKKESDKWENPELSLIYYNHIKCDTSTIASSRGYKFKYNKNKDWIEKKFYVTDKFSKSELVKLKTREILYY